MKQLRKGKRRNQEKGRGGSKGWGPERKGKGGAEYRGRGRGAAETEEAKEPKERGKRTS